MYSIPFSCAHEQQTLELGLSTGSTCPMPSLSHIEARLEKALDLSVGPDGVIGRKVQVVDVTAAGTARTVGEGILGWN